MIGERIVSSSSRRIQQLFPILSLFVFWIVLTGSLSIINIFLGLICSLLIIYIVKTLLIRNPYDDVKFIVFFRLPVFLLIMTWNIIKANIEVALIVLKPSLPINPRFFSIKTQLKGDYRKTILANCITLTPGTITVDIQDDILYVHGLTAYNEQSLREGNLEHIVAWLFGQKL